MSLLAETIPLSSACLPVLSAISLIWTFTLILVRPRKAQNLLLAQAFFFTAALGILHFWSIKAPSVPLLILVPCLKFFLIPMLFIYLRLLLPPAFAWKSKSYLHFLPGFILTVLLISIYSFYDWNLNTWENITISIFRPVGLIQGAIYMALSVSTIQEAKEIFLKNTSHWEMVRLKWAWLFLFQYAALWLSNIFNLFFVGTLYPNLLWNIVAVLGQGALTAYALRYSFTFVEIEPNETKTSKTGFDDAQIKIEAQKLFQKIQESKAYMEPNFTLRDLALLVRMPAYQVSEIINRGLSQNFFDLINSLRIEEASRVLKMKEAQDKTILEIAYSVGYNSKSAFNSAFKKCKGTTPSQFRELSV